MTIREMTSAEAQSRACIGPEGAGRNSNGTITIGGPLRFCCGADCMAWATGASKGGDTVVERVKGHGGQFSHFTRERPKLYWIFEPDPGFEGGLTQPGMWVGFEKVAVGHCAFVEKAADHR